MVTSEFKTYLQVPSIKESENIWFKDRKLQAEYVRSNKVSPFDKHQPGLDIFHCVGNICDVLIACSSFTTKISVTRNLISFF